MGDPDYSQSFDSIFALSPLADGAAEARFPFAWGGATLACAVLAACRSCPDKDLHSLHSWFLRPVLAETPARVAVERLRDGRQISHRRVQLFADDKLLHELTASFSAPGGPDAIAYQDARPDPGIPGPEGLKTLLQIALDEGRTAWPGPLEWAPIGSPHIHGSGGAPTSWDAWVRLTAPLPDGVGWAAAALAYMSDNHSDWCMAQQVKDYTITRYSTLDTAIWLHHPPRWDDWLLVRSVSDVAHDGFGIVRRTAYDRRGRLVATMAQEALYR